MYTRSSTSHAGGDLSTVSVSKFSKKPEAVGRHSGIVQSLSRKLSLKLYSNQGAMSSSPKVVVDSENFRSRIYMACVTQVFMCVS